MAFEKKVVVYWFIFCKMIFFVRAFEKMLISKDMQWLQIAYVFYKAK